MSAKNKAFNKSLILTEQRIAEIAKQQELSKTESLPITYEGHDAATGTAKFNRNGEAITGGQVVTTGAIAVGETVLSRPTEGLLRIDNSPTTSSSSECGSGAAPIARDFGSSGGGKVVPKAGYTCPKKGTIKEGSRRIVGLSEQYEVYTGRRKPGVIIGGAPKDLWLLCETEIVTAPGNPYDGLGDAIGNDNYCDGLFQAELRWSSGYHVSSNPPIRYELQETVAYKIKVDWNGDIEYLVGDVAFVQDASSHGLNYVYSFYTNEGEFISSFPASSGGEFFENGYLVQPDTFFLDGATETYSDQGFGVGSHLLYEKIESGIVETGASFGYNPSYYVVLSDFVVTTNYKAYRVSTNEVSSERRTAIPPTVSNVPLYKVLIYDSTQVEPIAVYEYEELPTNFRYTCRSKSIG